MASSSSFWKRCMHSYNCWKDIVVPKPPPPVYVFGPLLIYMWVLSQSYQLSSKLHLVSPNSTFFPFIPYVSQCFPRMIFLLLLLSLFFPQNPPKCWPSSPFYSLSLVGLSSLPFPHFACIPTSIRIPRNPHNLRGISWTYSRRQIVSGSEFPKGTDSAWLLTLIWLSLFWLSSCLLVNIRPSLART